MKKLIFTFFALLFLVGCGEDEVATNAKFKPFSEGEEVLLKGVAGKDLTLVRKNGGFVVKDQEDKFLMIDIFGTFCPPCQKEAPSIMQYQIDNKDSFNIVGLTHFENVTDDYVLDEFIKKFNAFYFITNDQRVNERVVEQVIQDIKYHREIALPFKVLLKNGEYQLLTDNDSGKFGVKYYIGGIKMDRFKQDVERIVQNH